MQILCEYLQRSSAEEVQELRGANGKPRIDSGLDE